LNGRARGGGGAGTEAATDRSHPRRVGHFDDVEANQDVLDLLDCVKRPGELGEQEDVVAVQATTGETNDIALGPSFECCVIQVDWSVDVHRRVGSWRTERRDVA